MSIGNAWHIPKNPQPSGQETMRSPFEGIESDVTVTLSTGNQFKGPGVIGNQTQAGSALMFRRAGDATWQTSSMRFQTAFSNDKFFFSTIAANTFRAGDVVEYYFKVDYTYRVATFLHGTNSGSFATDNEATARANPFTFAIRQPLQAVGSFLSFNAGSFEARIFRDSGHVAIAGPNLAGTAKALVVALAPPVIDVGDRTFQIGQVLSSTQLADGIEVIQRLGVGQMRARVTFAVDGVMRYEVLDWQGPGPTRVSLSAASDADEHFFGFGEKFNAFDQAGRVVDILTFDNPGAKGDRSYKVAPWFVSSRGYGLHLDSTARSTFDMRAAARGRYDIESQTSTLRVYIVFGPRLTDVLGRYTQLTGRPPLPPPWAFGPWISSDIWRTGGEVRYAVTHFRARRIPVSAFVFDSPWEVAYNDFAFNEAQFAAPATFENQSFSGFANTGELMRFLQQNGLKVICWMTPFVNVESNDEFVPGQNLGRAKNYEEGETNHHFVRKSQNGPPLVVTWWKGRGSPIDFTNPKARDWLTAQLRALLKRSEVTTSSGKEPAIGGFKTDDGEFGNGPNTYIPNSAIYANGLTGRDFVNGYCREYHKTVYNAVAPNGLLFGRSGFTGTQAFPGCWAGDNQPNFGTDAGLPSVIVAGLSAAMSGFSIWGHDVGGYENGNFSPVSPADLFMRWAQFGCFTPIMQMHRQVNPADLRQYPWGYARPGESLDRNDALDNYRFYAALHTRLFPYLYTHAKESQDNGLPIMRPVVLMHQDDPRTFSVEHTYYFGKHLLVAPIIQPLVTERRLYLPEGTWFDFWTNEQHAGRQDIVWKNPTTPTVPKSKIPLFVRGGAILPFTLGDEVETLCDVTYINNAAVKTWDSGLDVSIYPAGVSEFVMFDATEIVCTEGPEPISVRVTSATPRSIVMRVRAPRPAAVRRDGTLLGEATSAAAFAAATSAWRFDPVLGFVLVKFDHSGGAVTITV